MPGLTSLHGAQMLEPIFGWEDIFKSRPKLGAYYAAVQADPVGAKVRAPTYSTMNRPSTYSKVRCWGRTPIACALAKKHGDISGGPHPQPQIF